MRTSRWCSSQNSTTARPRCPGCGWTSSSWRPPRTTTYTMCQVSRASTAAGGAYLEQPTVPKRHVTCVSSMVERVQHVVRNDLNSGVWLKATKLPMSNASRLLLALRRRGSCLQLCTKLSRSISTGCLLSDLSRRSPPFALYICHPFLTPKLDGDATAIKFFREGHVRPSQAHPPCSRWILHTTSVSSFSM